MLPVILAPLLANLAQSGLGLLSTAIQAKGKDIVEKALGVEIPDNPTPKDLEALRQAQFEHEEKLMALSVEKAKQDLEAFKAEVADRDSARDRDVDLAKAGRRNYRADVMVAIAAVSVAGLVWLVWKDPSLNEYVKGIVTLVLGRFLGYLDNIYSFEFGTTRGSKDKDETIKQLSGSPK